MLPHVRQRLTFTMICWTSHGKLVFFSMLRIAAPVATILIVHENGDQPHRGDPGTFIHAIFMSSH